jgi:ATP-dependent RNA helicase DHX29
VKYHISAKSNIALKHMRTQLALVLSQQFRGKPLTDSQVAWYELGLLILGKVKLADVENGIPDIKVH